MAHLPQYAKHMQQTSHNYNNFCHNSPSLANITYLWLCSFYIAALVVANILSVSHFINFELTVWHWQLPFIIPVGAVVYPITFLCTDLICELFGKQYAINLIWIGLLVNLCTSGLIFLLGLNPDYESTSTAFYTIRKLSLGVTISSSIAYLVTQRLDIWIFEWCKKATNGKHLWLRNNVSIMISQLVDTTIVILIIQATTQAIYVEIGQSQTDAVFNVIRSVYIFKFLMAIIETLPFYIIVLLMKPKLTQNTGNIPQPTYCT